MTTESEVNKLANHLLNKGLAMTKSSAMDMAKEISSTTKKLNDSKESSGKERRRPSETSAEASKARQDNIAKMREKALKNNPVEIKADYEVPGIRGDATLNDISQGKGLGSEASEEAEEPEDDPLVNQVEKAEKPAVPAAASSGISDMPESKVDLNDMFKS